MNEGRRRQTRSPKCVLAAVIERDVDRIAGVAKRSCLTAETDGDAARDGSVVKNALEIRAAEIDSVVPAKRTADLIDGHRFPDGTFRYSRIGS